MKYIKEFRDKKTIHKVAVAIKQIMPASGVNLMEVCGTHTQSFYRFGLDKMLPSQLKLITGPGCPVCVSTQEYIDAAIALADVKDVLILSFGDMLRVPGSRSTLEKERARSGRIQVVYSPLDGLALAKHYPQKRVVFLAVGFETTAAAFALTIALARKEKISNLFFLTSLKLIPPAMEHLLKDARLNLNGFLCPGHVSAIIGSRAYEFIPRKYGIACCVAGFEPLDILEGIYFLLLQIVKKKPQVTNQYKRVVPRCGNLKAQRIMKEVFEGMDASWRGLGCIPGSGLKIRGAYSALDAQKEFSILFNRPNSVSRCRCGDVLKGLISPADCPLFRIKCSPDNPVGPCMVTQEGACHVAYKYR